MTLNGISFGASVLASISTIIINAAPDSIESGKTLLLSLPTISRTTFGITKPIHPIVPLTDTAPAVKSVAIPIKMPIFAL